MKRNGFTVIEMLAVLCIIGLLIILGVPGYMTVYVSIRRNNYHNKIKEIEVAGAKYGSSRKDDIKKYYDENNRCYETNVHDLIQLGFLASESAAAEYMKNPTTGGNMDGTVFLCYDYEKYDVTAIYAVPFEDTGSYYQTERVYANEGGTLKIYDTIRDYIGSTTCKELSGIKDHPIGYNHNNGIDKLMNCATKKQGNQTIAASEPFFKEINT